MKSIFILLIVVCCKVQAQTCYIDSDLQKFARKTLIDCIQVYGDDINQAGAVIMESNSGRVLTDICVGSFHRVVKDIPDGNAEGVECGIARAALFLTLMDKVTPSYVVDTGEGEYIDSISGCHVKDMSSGNGYHQLSLKKCLDISNVGIIMALDDVFQKNLQEYGKSLWKTGVFFQSMNFETEYATNIGQWRACDILGFNSPYSLRQMTAWTNMLHNGGKLIMRFNSQDSASPILEVHNKAALDSLCEAMRMVVTEGTGIDMNSNYTAVAGIADVSAPDVINCRGCTAFACFPYKSDSVGFTIGIYIRKHDIPVERRIATLCVRRIIDYMMEGKYITKFAAGVKSDIELKRDRYHPADKGRY